VIDTEVTNAQGTPLDELNDYCSEIEVDENGNVKDKRLGSNKAKAFFEWYINEKEVEYIYFKPYLTWAAKGRMDGPETKRVVEETEIYYKYHPSAFTRVLTKDIELDDEMFLTLPPSVYVKAEYRKE